MWELYDELIEGIPGGVTVDRITVGLHWTVVTAGNYCGTAMTVKEQEAAPDARADGRGQPLKYLASLAKSWNFIEASIGVAAVNAYYNNRETWKQAGSPGDTPWELVGAENAFDSYARDVKGKKVAIVGHFRHLENYLTEAAQISVLERRPAGDDYPDSACEYILPGQDFVFITGSAMINKTLPRLLRLSEAARVILVGPSATMAPVLFRHGVDEMSGFLVGSIDGVTGAAAMAGHQTFFESGERIRMIKKRPFKSTCSI